LPGHKPSKDHLTLCLCGNAAEDFKLKSVLVYHSVNASTMKSFEKCKLPVIWESNKKASVTKALFLDWFCHHFCPAVEIYVRKNNLEKKGFVDH
jgi:hypothetical protein